LLAVHGALTIVSKMLKVKEVLVPHPFATRSSPMLNNLPLMILRF
jgi:hypothetical protein